MGHFEVGDSFPVAEGGELTRLTAPLSDSKAKSTSVFRSSRYFKYSLLLAFLLTATYFIGAVRKSFRYVNSNPRLDLIRFEPVSTNKSTGNTKLIIENNSSGYFFFSGYRGGGLFYQVERLNRGVWQHAGGCWCGTGVELIELPPYSTRFVNVVSRRDPGIYRITFSISVIPKWRSKSSEEDYQLVGVVKSGRVVWGSDGEAGSRQKPSNLRPESEQVDKSFAEILGPAAAAFERAPPGLSRVRALIPFRAALKGARLDERQGRLVAAAIRQELEFEIEKLAAEAGFKGKNRYGSSWGIGTCYDHASRELMKLIVDNELNVLAWYYRHMLNHSDGRLRREAIIALEKLGESP